MEEGGLERKEIAYQSELLWKKQLVYASALFCSGFFQRRWPSKGGSRAVVVCRTDLFLAGKGVTGVSWGVSSWTFDCEEF